jgi:hypothetical protein
MAQGCISVIEMTVTLGFMQQNPRCGVMAKGKNLPRLNMLQAGQGFVGMLLFHRLSNIRLTCSMRSPIQRTLLTHQELPSALYRGPSGHWSAGFLRQGMRV